MLTATQAWKTLLYKILKDGTEVSPRGQLTKEILGCQSVFDMEFPVVTIAERKLGYKFLAAEAWWILTGSNRVEDIAPYSKMISKFSDDGLTFKGAYGTKVIEQISYIVQTLLNDPSSRQAVLSIWRERPGPSKDIPCTISSQWLLREDISSGTIKLHCFVNMRSSDGWLGVPYDWFNFSMISGLILAMLKQQGFEGKLKLGNMYFTAASQHLYDQHWELGEKCVDSDNELFTYDAFNASEFTDKPFELVSHLKILADTDNTKIKYKSLSELMYNKKQEILDDSEKTPRGY